MGVAAGSWSAGTKCWLLAAVAGATMVACGGNTKRQSDPAAGTGSVGTDDASAESSVGAGGSPGTTGDTLDASVSTVAVSGGSIVGGSSTGGQASATVGAGGADGCNEGELWYSVARARVGIGRCEPALCEDSSVVFGTVTFDEEGRAIGFTGPEEERVEQWLMEVADERWLCLAGQTVEYCCVPR